ncbi:hypothetical protein Pelo_13685 [Pelomyxa schiedti]|nr:hypothetical protein Pelo_13685 [Pelomyxa schiedti]
MKKGTSSTGTNTSTLSGSKTASRGKKSLFQRAINPRDAAAFTTEELHVVVYWMRQALGIVLGLIWGLIPLTGALGFILCGPLPRSFVPLLILTMFVVYQPGLLHATW